MPQPNDLSRSLIPLQQDSTLVAVIELSRSSWLVAGTVPGIERQPLKKLDADEQALLRLLRRWQDEATKAGGLPREWGCEAERGTFRPVFPLRQRQRGLDREAGEHRG